jgi:hypothetical protein
VVGFVCRELRHHKLEQLHQLLQSETRFREPLA